MTEALIPALNLSCARNSVVGCHKRAQAALAQLHLPNKKFITSEKLMASSSENYFNIYLIYLLKNI